MRRTAVLVWLVVLWLVLWRDASLANVLSGTVVALVVTTLYPLHPPSSSRHTIRPVPLLAFVAYFVWQLLVSNILVARVILSPRIRVRTGIVALHLPGCSDLVTTLVANAITLTPGTMTLEVSDDRRTLYVHVLHVQDLDAVRRDLHTLLRRALLALGTDEDLANLEQDPTEPAETVDEGGTGEAERAETQEKAP